MPINLTEPTGPRERAIAVRMCRLNAWLDPETGLPERDREKTMRLWYSQEKTLPLGKWLWMWNHGQSEWDMSRKREQVGEENR